jgi:hypothetical protein
MKSVIVPFDEVGIEITCGNCGSGQVFAVPQKVNPICHVCGCDTLGKAAAALEHLSEFRTAAYEFINAKDDGSNKISFRWEAESAADSITGRELKDLDAFLKRRKRGATLE